MELSSTLHAIGAHDHKLAMRELKVLSGLVYDQRGEFWPTWAAISPHRRAEIARAMVDLAEDNVDLDFAQTLLWMLDDDDAEVRASAAEGLWESENLAVLRRLVTALRADPAPAVRAAAAIALAGSAYRAELGELDDRDASALREGLQATVHDERQPLEVRRRALDLTGMREWRQRRHLSQLDLAGDAEISARHLSFVETGRAAPSREMVLRLAERLDVPLRERNVLLVAAGFAPAFPDRSLDDPALAASARLTAMMSRNWQASKSARSRSKLNACPRPSALAYRDRRSASTHASATAVRGGSYSLKTVRHSA